MKNIKIAIISLITSLSVFATDVSEINCQSDSGRTVVTATNGGDYFYLTAVQDGVTYLHRNVATSGRFLWAESSPPQFAGGKLTGRSSGRVYLEIGAPGTYDYVHYDKIDLLGRLFHFRTPVICNIETEE